MIRKALVIDANILIRAVLGKKVLDLLSRYKDSTVFFAPDEAYADAEVGALQHSPMCRMTIG